MTSEKIGMPKDYCIYCSHRYTTICKRCSNGSHRIEREGWLQQHKRHINNQQKVQKQYSAETLKQAMQMLKGE